MYWNQVHGNWKHIKASLKLHWSEFNDYQLDAIAVKYDELARKIQVAYSFIIDEVEKHNSNWQHLQKKLSNTTNHIQPVIKDNA